jgi:hypothetical protein
MNAGTPGAARRKTVSDNQHDEQHDERAQRIREIAYGLWEKEGSPEGRHEEFWLRAEAVLDQDENLPHSPSEPAVPHESVDVESEHSFPASDPPSFTPSNTGGTKNKAA